MKRKLLYILLLLLPFGIVAFCLFYVIRRSMRRSEVKKVHEEKTKSLGWKYFTLNELDSRKDKSKPIDEKYVKALDILVKNVLDPLREAYGKPIHVNSGLRDFVPSGGSETSHHQIGAAVDIEGCDYSNAENKKLAEIYLRLGLPYSQLINEHNWSWFHVGYTPTDNRKRLTLSSGDRAKPKYTQVNSTSKFLVGGDLLK